MKRELYPLRFLLAFIITNLIFMAIIVTTQSVSYWNYKTISTLNEELQQDLNKMQFIAQNSETNCSSEKLIQISQTLDENGAKIDILENSLGKNNPTVLEQKQIYSEMELQHLAVVKEIGKNCNHNYTTILFFYSNGDNSEASSRTGLILSSLKKENPETMIYSFDFSLDIESINSLKRTYGINSTPEIILGNTNIGNVQDVESLKKIILHA